MNSTPVAAAAAIPCHSGPCPLDSLGQEVFEREIPSASPLITPVVVRALGILRSLGCINPHSENRVGVCLGEGLLNAVQHGNKSDFSKKVTLNVFVGQEQIAFVIRDQGSGLSIASMSVLCSTGPEGLPSGCGMRILAHYMDSLEFYDGGRTLLMKRRRDQDVMPMEGEKQMENIRDEALVSKLHGEVIVFSVMRGAIKDGPAIVRELEGLGHYVRWHPQCKVVLDLEKLEYFSSTALGVLVGLLKRVKAAEGSLKICAVQKQIMEVLTLLRLNTIFDMYATVNEAVASFKVPAPKSKKTTPAT